MAYFPAPLRGLLYYVYVHWPIGWHWLATCLMTADASLSPRLLSFPWRHDGQLDDNLHVMAEILAELLGLCDIGNSPFEPSPLEPPSSCDVANLAILTKRLQWR